MNPNEPKLTGGCYCGKVRYECVEFPEGRRYRGLCYCLTCQKISGGAGNFFMAVDAQTFRFTDGTPRSFTAEDHPWHPRRHFCEICGVHLTARSDHAPSAVLVKVGTLDEPGVFEGPGSVTWTSEMQKFHLLPPNVPAWPELPVPKTNAAKAAEKPTTAGPALHHSLVRSCIPVVPCSDLEKSLRFWSEAVGLKMDRALHEDDRLIGCMVQTEHVSFWLNQRAGSTQKPDQYEGIRLYWAPEDLGALRNRLAQLGYAVSETQTREYGQTEFFVTDDDGYSHCFGVPTSQAS